MTESSWQSYQLPKGGRHSSNDSAHYALDRVHRKPSFPCIFVTVNVVSRSMLEEDIQSGRPSETVRTKIEMQSVPSG